MNLLDTGIVIAMLREKEQRQGTISITTFAETLRSVNPQKRPAIKQLPEESFTILNLDTAIAEKYCASTATSKNKAHYCPTQTYSSPQPP